MRLWWQRSFLDLLEHRRYLEGRRSFPVRIAKRDFNGADELLQDIRQVKRQEPKAPVNPPDWISETTWKLVDYRAQGRRAGSLPGRSLRVVNSAIRRNLRKDRKRRTEAAGAAIQAALEDNNLRGAWKLMKRWYASASGRPPKPSKVDMRAIEQEYAALRHCTVQRSHLETHYQSITTLYLSWIAFRRMRRY
jgi:hypothetical protein